jgi:hypothetical protein
MQRATHAANNTEGIFSMGSDLRLYNESLLVATSDVYLGLFADDTCIYATDRKDVYVPVLTPRLNSTETSLQLSETYPSLRSVAYIQVSSAKGPR